MENDPDPNLEQLIHGQLQKLPYFAAPSTLIPRVMAVLQAQAQGPWWCNAWSSWPLPAKAAFLIMAVALAGFVSNSSSMVSDGMSAYSQQVAGRLGVFAVLGDILVRLANVLGEVGLNTAEPLLIYGLVTAAVLYLVCLGLGTMFVRVASKRS